MILYLNAGKDFENQFKASVPNGVYYQRIKDPAQSFNQSTSLRFSLQNPYDCFMFSYPNLFTLELKSTEGSSLTFYREDFVSKDKKQTFMVKKNQIQGLLESRDSNGVISGLIINFRKVARTYFIDIYDFTRMINSLNKKSFNEEDIKIYNGYLIEQELKKVKYKYNLQKFIDDLKEKFN